MYKVFSPGGGVIITNELSFVRPGLLTGEDFTRPPPPCGNQKLNFMHDIVDHFFYRELYMPPMARYILVFFFTFSLFQFASWVANPDPVFLDGRIRIRVNSTRFRYHVLIIYPNNDYIISNIRSVPAPCFFYLDGRTRIRAFLKVDPVSGSTSPGSASSHLSIRISLLWLK